MAGSLWPLTVARREHLVKEALQLARPPIASWYRDLIERYGGLFAGYSSDIHGCRAVGKSLDEVVASVHLQVQEKVGEIRRTNPGHAAPEQMVPVPVVL